MELAFLAFAALSALAWSYLFLRRDRFDPEPRSLLIKLFFGGVLAAIVAGFVNEGALEAGVSEGVVVAFVAPPVEEVLKLAAVIFFAYRSRHFTQRVDGAIYGASCGFGFAFIENFLYALEFGAGTLALRSVLLPIGHPLFTGVAGYFLAKTRFDHGPLQAMMGLVFAIALHMAWNLPAGLAEMASDWWALLFLVVLPAQIFVLTRLLKRMSHPEAQALRRLVDPHKLSEPVSAD
jgi:protease PrsW